MDRVLPEKTLLTIAIPTFNRKAYLTQLLDEIYNQRNDFNGLVEILVSDNASTDGTENIIREVEKRGLPLIYLRNNSNFGPDANILQCFEKASGHYLWIIGDDDNIVHDGIKKILTYLKADEEYDLIYINSFSFGGSDTPDLRLSSRVGSARSIRNVYYFASRVNAFFTFISGNIVNRASVLKARRGGFESLLGTNLVQLGWIYTALNDFSRGLYVDEQIVAMRIGNTGGYQLAQVFGVNLSEITDRWIHDPNLKQIIIDRTLKKFWPHMLVEYMHSKHNFQEEGQLREKLTRVFNRYPSYWLFVYPILVIPPGLLKLWILFPRVVNGVDKLILRARSCGSQN